MVTKHQVTVRGTPLKYTVTTGLMPVKNEQGVTEGQIFFMAYTLDGAEPGSRPLMFSFNGGPGSSSVWLHLGALGPRRVRMDDEGWMPAAPYLHWTSCSTVTTRTAETRARTGMACSSFGCAGRNCGTRELPTWRSWLPTLYMLSPLGPYSQTTFKQLPSDGSKL